jgi:hypothetical protein
MSGSSIASSSISAAASTLQWPRSHNWLANLVTEEYSPSIHLPYPRLKVKGGNVYNRVQKRNLG